MHSVKGAYINRKILKNASAALVGQHFVSRGYHQITLSHLDEVKTSTALTH